MNKIPLELQVFPDDPLLDVQTKIKSGKDVSGVELIGLIEHLTGQSFPLVLREIVESAHIPAVGKSGRPSNFGARQDFAMERLDQRYPEVLQEERNKGSLAPSEQAYRVLKEEFQEDFTVAGWEGLRNLHSAWRIGRFHPKDIVA